jgi:hypothetical protein
MIKKLSTININLNNLNLMSRFLYPHTWKISDKIETIINKYNHIENSQ